MGWVFITHKWIFRFVHSLAQPFVCVFHNFEIGYTFIPPSMDVIHIGKLTSCHHFGHYSNFIICIIWCLPNYLADFCQINSLRSFLMVKSLRRQQMERLQISAIVNIIIWHQIINFILMFDCSMLVISSDQNMIEILFIPFKLLVKVSYFLFLCQ